MSSIFADCLPFLLVSIRQLGLIAAKVVMSVNTSMLMSLCFPMRCKSLALILPLLVLAVGWSSLQAEEVSRKAPAAYEQHLKPRLTPVEEIKAWKNKHADEDIPGVILVSETLTRVEEDGTYIRAKRAIYRPQSQQGVDQITTDQFRYSARQERVHLVEARTIQPDGEIKELGPNAAFIQKGDQKASSIYDDSQELVVVFPDVKPGVMCEVIVVYERFDPPVAKGFSKRRFWSTGWPVLSKRMLVDMPKAWEERVQFKSIASDVKPQRLKSEDDRLVHEWLKKDIEEGDFEIAKAPVDQVGPVSWITTFQNWDEVAAWYQGLLNERNELGAELEKQVDEWTKGVKDPNKILEILHVRPPGCGWAARAPPRGAACVRGAASLRAMRST